MRFLSRFLRSLTIALGRELFDTFTVGKPSQKVERRRRTFTALIFIVGCLMHTRSVSQPLHQKSGAHTLELGLPTLTRAGQRKPGVASNSGRLCHPKLESLSSLIIHNTVSLCTFPSSIRLILDPTAKGCLRRQRACCCFVKCQHRRFSELGCSFSEAKARVTKSRSSGGYRRSVSMQW